MINFKKIKEYILAFTFTRRCRFCNRVCDVRNDICDSCYDDIKTIDGEICYNCGCSKLICDSCENRHFYESVCAPYYYDGAARQGVITLKHNDFSSVVDGLSADMLNCVHTHYKSLDFDCCTFVPMHKDDIKKRGYNQSQLLAEKIAQALDIPCYELLSKDFKTKAQHALPPILRSGNLLGAISYKADNKINIEGMRILLCDDVKTTGCTLDECTKTLLFEGCAEVRCVTACIRYKTTKNEKD